MSSNESGEYPPYFVEPSGVAEPRRSDQLPVLAAEAIESQTEMQLRLLRKDKASILLEINLQYQSQPDTRHGVF